MRPIALGRPFEAARIGAPTYRSDQAAGFVGEAGNAAAGESSDEVDGREGRLAGVGSLFSEDVEHDPWGEVELVEQEVVGVDDLDAERPEHVHRIVADVCRDDGISPAAESGGNDVAVVSVGECHGVLRGLSSLDAGFLEGAAHGSEPGPDSFGWDLGMDVDDGVDGLGDDPSGPKRPVEVAFGEL